MFFILYLYIFNKYRVPYGLVVALDFDNVVPMSYHALVTLMAHVNSGMNPILYITLNPVFKESFLKLLKFSLFKGNKESTNKFSNLNSQNLKQSTLA